MSEVNSDHSVSDWLTTINASHGEAETAWRRLWDRYAPGMTALAWERLGHRRKPLADEEDVVIEAFKDLARRWRKVASLASLSFRELWQTFQCWRQTDEP